MDRRLMTWRGGRGGFHGGCGGYHGWRVGFLSGRVGFHGRRWRSWRCAQKQSAKLPRGNCSRNRSRSRPSPPPARPPLILQHRTDPMTEAFPCASLAHTRKQPLAQPPWTLRNQFAAYWRRHRTRCAKQHLGTCVPPAATANIVSTCSPLHRARVNARRNRSELIPVPKPPLHSRATKKPAPLSPICCYPM